MNTKPHLEKIDMEEPMNMETSLRVLAKKVNEIIDHLSLGEEGKEIQKRCSKCLNPFEPHHHRHITREGQFHTSCYKEAPAEDCMAIGKQATLPAEWDWRKEFDKKFPNLGTEGIDKKTKMKSFISQVETSARTREREEVRGKANRLFEKIDINGGRTMYEAGYKDAISDLLSSLQD